MNAERFAAYVAEYAATPIMTAAGWRAEHNGGGCGIYRKDLACGCMLVIMGDDGAMKRVRAANGGGQPYPKARDFAQAA